MALEKAQGAGYLPNEAPGIGGLLSLGFQHVLAMFPATILVAILTKFDVGVTLFASGLATTVALLGSGMRIPMYYGSSFSYIAAVVGVLGASWGGPRVAQAGIVGTAVVNVLVGLLIMKVGKKSLDKVLPPVVTGSVALVIGLSLAKTALDQAGQHWAVAGVTLLATVAFSVYFRGRGLLGMLPVLLGALAGYFTALFCGLVNFEAVLAAPWIQVPAFRLPDFSGAGMWKAMLAIAPIAIATIPESTAHLYQISLYVDTLAGEKGKPPVGLKNLIGLNLILDGVGDFINGMLGGCAGTNYGENNSLMAITRNYSTRVLVVAGFMAMALGFIGKLSAVVGTLPVAVTGGLAIYLFGVIGLQGAALMISEKVNLFDPRELAVGAVILVVGVGGSYLEGGNLNVFGLQLPAIATAAVLGIVLNLLFLFTTKHGTEA